MSDLTNKQRQEIAAVLAEIKRRGLQDKVKEIRESSSVSRAFHTDSNGYFVRFDGKQYNPSPDQKAFVDSNAYFSLASGGRGSGKSATGSQKCLRKIAKGYNGAVINPRFEDFKLSTWPAFREWIPWNTVVPKQRYRALPEWEPNQPFRLAFMNGATVICKGLKDPDSARGPNINWLWYDEGGTDRDGLSWNIAIASVRVGENPQAWVTTTPKGRFHWIYDFFFGDTEEMLSADLYKRFIELSGGRELIETFHLDLEDNMDNLDPGFMLALERAYVHGSNLYRQEVKGEFVSDLASLGDAAWFNGKVLPEPPETVLKRIRYWDLAATEEKIIKQTKKVKQPDETVGTKLSHFEAAKFCIEHQVAGRWAWGNIKERIVEIARLDGPFVKVYIEQEPGAGGKNQIAELIDYVKKQLGPSWQVEGHRPEGDKVMRAQSWFAEASNGWFYMVQGSWNQGFLEQLGAFPDVPHDDRVDSVSGARQIIAPFVKVWKSIEFLHL